MEQSLCRYIETTLLPAGSGITVGPDDDLLTVGMLDSLQVMRLVQHVEASSGLTVPPADLVLENFQTARHIAAYLSRRAQA